MAAMRGILVIGVTCQIGAEHTPALRERFGGAKFHARELDQNLTSTSPCCTVEVRGLSALTALIADHGIGTIYHLGALFSAVAEVKPQLVWDINVNGLMNVLEVARMYDCAVFFSSSIGAFGPSTPSGSR